MNEDHLALRVGAVLLAAVGLAAAAVVYFTGHSIAPGLLFHVDWARIGNLSPGAKVRVIGREIGEVRDITMAPRAKAETAPLVRVHLWIRRDFRDSIRRNSELLVASDKVIGDRYVTVRPPRGEPGPPVAAGDVLRGVDPPPLDEFLLRYADNLLVLTRLFSENSDVIAALQQATAQARSTLERLDRDGQHLPRIRAQLRTASAELAALRRGLDAATDHYRTPRRIRQQLALLSKPEARQLGAIALQLEQVGRQVEAVAQVLDAPAQRQLTTALARLQQTAAALGPLLKALRALAAATAAGSGTIGGVLTDRELFDELKLLRRILIERPWKVLAKPVSSPR